MPSPDPYAAHYEALGRMLVAFQTIEATLTNGLVLLLNSMSRRYSGPLALLVLSELSFVAMSKIASNLPTLISSEGISRTSPPSAEALKLKLTTCEKALLKGLKLAVQVEQRRNQLVHSQWLVSTDLRLPPSTFTRVKIKTRARRILYEKAHESVSDIDACTAHAQEAQKLLVSALSGYHSIVNERW